MQTRARGSNKRPSTDDDDVVKEGSPASVETPSRKRAASAPKPAGLILAVFLERVLKDDTRRLQVHVHVYLFNVIHADFAGEGRVFIRLSVFFLFPNVRQKEFPKSTEFVSQLVASAAKDEVQRAASLRPLLVDFAAYPRDCALRLLTLAVAQSRQAFTVLAGHGDLTALTRVLGFEVNVALQEMHHCIAEFEGYRAIVEAYDTPRRAAQTPSPPPLSSAPALVLEVVQGPALSLDPPACDCGNCGIGKLGVDRSDTATSAVMQEHQVNLGLKHYSRGAENVRGACVDAVLSQPPPWLTPNLSTGVTSLWLLLSVAMHSALQFKLVLTTCPNILLDCISIVKSAKHAECFRLTRGSGIYGPAWRLLQLAVELDGGLARLDTRRVIATLLSGSVSTATTELAVLVTRTVLAVAEDRVQVLLSEAERPALAQLLANLLVQCGVGKDGGARTVRLLAVTAMRLLVFKVPAMARVFLGQAVVAALTRAVCGAATGDLDDMTCAEQAMDVLNQCVFMAADSDQAGATDVVAYLVNSVLQELREYLQHLRPYAAPAARPTMFFYEVFNKWAPVAGARVVMPPTLPEQVISILQAAPVSVPLQAKYDTACLVRRLGQHASMFGLQSTLPALLQVCEGCDVLRETSLETAVWMREMCLDAVTSLIYNRVPCRYLTDNDVCGRIVGVATAAFTAVDHVASATARACGLPVPDCHLHDIGCAHAFLCLKRVFEACSGEVHYEAQLRTNTRFMHTLHIMAHPSYGCVPSRYSHFFTTFLKMLVPMQEDVAAGRQAAVAAVLEVVAGTELVSTKGPAEPNVCCVCLGPATTSAYTHDACRQTYHVQCLGQWLSTKDSCPSCRKAVLEL